MDDTQEGPRRLLTPKQAAERLGLAVQTLAKRRCSGDSPEFYKIGAAVRYDAEKIEAWLEKQPRRTSTSDTPEPQAA